MGMGINQREIVTDDLRPLMPFDQGVEIDFRDHSSENVTEIVEPILLEMKKPTVVYQATVPKKTIEPVEVLPSFKTELPDWATAMIAMMAAVAMFIAVALIVAGSPLAPLAAWSIVVGVITAMWCAVRGISNRQAVYDGSAIE